MNFNKTTSNDFAILKNGIDSSIEIVQHKASGFYNITKMSKLVHRNRQNEIEKVKNNETAGNPADSLKPSRNWFVNTSTTELIEACKRYTNLESVHYELAAGTPKLYSGTYVHRFLYDHFMVWLDRDYAMRVSVILDKIHKDAQMSAIAAATKEKDDKIGRLKQKIDAQTLKINQLLGYAIDTKDALDDVQNDLAEAKEDIQIATTYLAEKSMSSTLNPSDTSKHHCFAATGFEKQTGEHVVKFITGQKSYVDKIIAQNVAIGHEIVINQFYNANGIDLRQNAFAEFKARRKQLIDNLNTANAVRDREFNDALKIEISEFNKNNPEIKRV